MHCHFYLGGSKDSDEDVKAMNGMTPMKAESDETEAIRKLCREFISEVIELRKPPQLYNRICDVFTSIQNRMPHVDKEQIEKLIGLLLLLSKDECRKSPNDVSWDGIYEMLIREYIPHADNGNTEIRIRQIATDMIAKTVFLGNDTEPSAVVKDTVDRAEDIDVIHRSSCAGFDGKGIATHHFKFDSCSFRIQGFVLLGKLFKPSEIVHVFTFLII